MPIIYNAVLVDSEVNITDTIPKCAADNRNISPSQISDNGAAVLVNTTDNGIDKFQVGGSVIADSLKINGGTSAQLLLANGTTTTQSQLSGSPLAYYLNGSISQGTILGSTYYQLDGAISGGASANFTKANNGLIAQFITNVGSPNQVLIPAGNWQCLYYMSISSSTAAFYVELLKYDGVAITSIASSAASPEFITNGSTKDLYSTAIAVPQTSIASTDRLIIRVYIVNSAANRTATLYTQDNNLSETLTTFPSTGISSLNGLTAATQKMVTGTSGTDFAIVASSSTNTFNLPDASATARGVVTTGAQTIVGTKAFSSNIKIPSVGSPLILAVALDGTVSGLTTTTYPSLTELSYVKDVTSAIQTQINAKGSGTVTSVAAITLGTTGTDLTSTVATGTTTPVITLNVPDASATARGVITTGTQTIVGQKQFQNLTGQGDGILGAELLTTGSGTGWTGTSFALGYAHTSNGGTTPLTSTFTPTIGAYYQVVYTVSSTTVSTVSIIMGGVNISGAIGNITATTIGIKATSTAALTLTPTLTTFNGTVVVSVKLITAGNATQTLASSAGTVTNELRASNIASNTLMGVGAGARITTGIENVIIGNAGTSLVTGSNNTFLGTSAANNIVASSNITAIGSNALSNLTAGGGNGNNVAVGSNAGRFISGGVTQNLSTNNSVFVGNQAYPLADAQTNQIVIGNGAVGLGSNSTILGNTTITKTGIFGRTLMGQTTLPTDNISDTLQVSGNINVTGGLKIARTSPATAGFATLVAGTVVVSSNYVTATSVILLTAQDTGISTGNLRVSARSVATSFTILSTSASDTCTVGWLIIN